MQTMFRFLLAAIAIATAGGCATNPVTGNPDFVLMSEEQEVTLGKQTHQQVMQRYSEYNDPELNALVQSLGEELAAQSHRQNLNWTFTLLDSPEVNAFATPGGYVYITRGIIAYMTNQEELAGVLGHEIGHVTARHSVRQHSVQTSAGIFSAVVGAVTGVQSLGTLSNTASQALVRGYGRDHELEADRLGAEYLAGIGYDPSKMLGVVALLKDQEEFEIARARAEDREPRTYHGLFSTHPRNDQRLQEVLEAAEKFKKPNPRQTDPEQFLRLLDGLDFGSSEEQGVVRGNEFYHKPLDLGLTLPVEWKVDNKPSELVMVSPAQDQAIAVRVGSASNSPRQYLSSKYQSLRNTQSIGDHSFTGITELKTSSGSRPARVAATAHNGKIIEVVGLARSDLPDDQMFGLVRSIRHLNNQERELAAARTIRLVRAKPGDTFASLAKDSDIDRFAEDQLRLLNDMYPDGEPEAGALIKIIQ